MIRCALDDLLKVFVESDFSVSEPRDVPLRNRFGLISSFHEVLRFSLCLNFQLANAAGNKDWAASHPQAEFSWMQLKPHRLSVLRENSVLQHGRLIPYAIERRAAEAPHWQQASSFLQRSLPLSCFLGAGVLFEPCPNQARPEKTLQENEPSTVYNLLTNISSFLRQVNSALVFAAFSPPWRRPAQSD